MVLSPLAAAALVADDDGDIGLGTLAPGANLEIRRNAAFSRINAGSTTFTASSSRKLKENIQKYEQADLLDRLSKVPVVTYDWKKGSFEGEEAERKNRMGLIAEDFHTILGRGSEEQIDGQELQSVLWLAVQQLSQENKKLRRRK